MEVGKPFVTYYDDATGERTELSYATFDNWVAKTANYLRDEHGVVPGQSVGLDLPVHWLTVVLAFAAWRAGATVVREGGDVSFTARDLADLRHDVLIHADRFDGAAPLPPATPSADRLMVVDVDPVPYALAAYTGRGSLVICRNADPALLPERAAVERAKPT